MKKVGIVLIFLMLGIIAMGCTQMTAKEIAKKMEEKYNKIKDMEGTMIITMELNGKKRADVIKFAIKKPNKFWSESNTTLSVCDGKTMWLYDKKTNEVIKLKLPKNKPKFDYGQFIEAMLKNNSVKLLGTGKVDGKNCYIVEIIPKNKTSYFSEQKLWIDKTYWYPIKVETISKLGNTTLEYKNLKFNTGIPDSLFEFKMPKGAKILNTSSTVIKPHLTISEAQKEVNFTIVTPTYTAGYKFKEASVFKFNGKESVMLIYYNNTGKSMMVSESVGYKCEKIPDSTVINVNGTKMELSGIFGIHSLRICKGNFKVTISAKLPKDEIIKIGKSIIESPKWKEV